MVKQSALGRGLRTHKVTTQEKTLSSIKLALRVP
jgi:hypothetical protein